MKKEKKRIFLKTNDEIREFLWFEKGKDGSIYLGSVVKFTSGSKGKLQVEKGNASGAFLDCTDGALMVEQELHGKTSYHDSGIINLQTISIDRRDRLQMKPLNQQEKNSQLPLVNIIPMNPTKYPISSKTIKDTDLVIDCNINKGKSLGIVFFVSFDNSKSGTIDRIMRKNSLSYAVVCKDFYDRKLCALIYYSDAFNGWPKNQIDAIAHPNNEGEMSWPIIMA